MAILLTVHFADGTKKSFECADDEDSTMRRDDLLESGFQEKGYKEHIFYPSQSIIKIVTKSED